MYVVFSRSASYASRERAEEKDDVPGGVGPERLRGRCVKQGGGEIPALVASGGPLRGQRFEIHGDLTIGRDQVGIVVDDPGVSRQHAALRVAEGRVTIEDLGSRNGTFVNGRRIDTATPLADGDVVRVGAIPFAFEGVGAGANATAKPQVGEPAEPFGTYATGDVAGHRRGGRVASRLLLPELIAIFAIVATAVALVLYFALR